MDTQTLATTNRLPTVFNDFFKPWSEWFDEGFTNGRSLLMPAVNITEDDNGYLVSVAAPGLKKENFKLNVNGDLLAIRCETELQEEEKRKKYTRKEYNFSYFNRSFTLPPEVDKNKIEAKYEEGILTVVLPRMEAAVKSMGKQIAVK